MLLKVLIRKWHIGICDGLIYITFLKLRFVYFLFSVVICADDFAVNKYTTSSRWYESQLCITSAHIKKSCMNVTQTWYIMFEKAPSSTQGLTSKNRVRIFAYDFRRRFQITSLWTRLLRLSTPTPVVNISQGNSPHINTYYMPCPFHHPWKDPR